MMISGRFAHWLTWRGMSRNTSRKYKYLFRKPPVKYCSLLSLNQW